MDFTAVADSLLISFMPYSTTLLAISACILCLVSFSSLAQRTSSSTACPPIPPGSSGLPLVGETFAFLSSFKANKGREFVRIRTAQYGHVFRTSLFLNPTIVLHGAEANRFLYSNEGKLVRQSWPKSLVQLLGQNTLVAQSGFQHRRLRRLVMTCLYPEALQKFVPKVDVLTQEHLSQHWLCRDQVFPYRLLKSHALDVASILLVGIEDPGRRERLKLHFNTFAAGLLTLPIYLPWTRYYRSHVARASLDKFLDELITLRTKELQAGHSAELKDLVSTLIVAKDDNGKPLTRKEIQDLIITLLFAGHDTNTSTISLVCKFLTENPEVQDEVVKEQTAIADSKNPGEKLGWEDIQKMKYTWRVIQESLRLEPVVPGSFHVALEDFEYGGFKIPRGWKIYQSLSSCHSDERYFQNPNKFDPSRFAGSGPAPYTFHPFGGGAHICAGMDFARMMTLVFLHHLVRRFKWTFGVNAKEHASIDQMYIPVQELDFPIMLEQRTV